MPFFVKRHSGFTLVELMASTAIIAILTTIVFVGFQNDRQRNASKRAAEQVQVDIQASQNNAQSGLLIPGTGTRSSGFGSYFDTGQNDRYLQFADATTGTTGQWDGSDPIVQTIRLKDGVTLARLCGDVADVARLSVVYALPNGNVSLQGWTAGGTPVIPTVGKIILRHPRLSQYYRITVTQVSGTVSRRETTTDTCT